MKKVSKYIITGLYFCLAFGLVFLIVKYYTNNVALKSENKQLQAYIDSEVTNNAKAGKYDTSDIIKTVAHITLDDKLFEQIYVDYDNDIAYYRYIGERDLVKVGDTVTIEDGNTSEVTDVTYPGFLIKANNDFHTGNSGMAVFNDKGVIIGYVSSLINDEVYCIWR